MAIATKGFMVPSNLTESYVDNERDLAGTFVYDNLQQDTNIAANAAIQQLNSQYSSTINDAYTSYLNSKRSVLSSNLGEGYKDAYIQQQQNELQSNLAKASVSAASTRQDIYSNASTALTDINTMKEAEVSNLNKVSETMAAYLDYANKLSNDQGETYIPATKQGLGIDYMYDFIYNPTNSPYGYKDTAGAEGKDYLSWVQSQMSTDTDRQWFDWLSTTGYNQFKQAANVDNTDNTDKQAIINNAADKQAIINNAAIVNIDKQELPTIDFNWNDFAAIDFGKKGYDKVLESEKSITDFAKKIGLSDIEITQALGSDIATALKDIADTITDRNKYAATGYSDINKDKYANARFTSILTKLKDAAKNKYKTEV